MDHYDQLLTDLELYIVQTAKQHDAHAFYRLRSVPGIGKILALVILYEIDDINRFPTVQDFVSYARLVKCAKESAGKRHGTSGKKIGNVHLKWLSRKPRYFFSELTQKDNDSWKNFHPNTVRPKLYRYSLTNWDGQSITCSVANRPLI